MARLENVTTCYMMAIYVIITTYTEIWVAVMKNATIMGMMILLVLKLIAVKAVIIVSTDFYVGLRGDND